MGAHQTQEIDAWLRDGGVVVTASDRAARAIASAYHRARLNEGMKAWTSPEILSWHRFARSEWERRVTDSRVVLNSIQEQALWTEIVASGGHAAAALAASRHRLAAMAMEAHALLCSYTSRHLDRRVHSGWANDAAAFSEWLASFDDACRDANALSADRVPLELIEALKRDTTPRPALLLAGFDRLLPLQHALFEAWGEWRRAGVGKEAGTAHFYAARDPEGELAACATWCRNRLAENPHARLLVLAQDVGSRRGEIERIFLDLQGPGAAPQFEFSLGVPLSGIAIVRSALLLLRWLGGDLEESQLDWLFATGHSAAAPGETAALQARMRELRRRGWQRTQWRLKAFLQQPLKPEIPVAWAARMRAAQHLLQVASQQNRSPLGWAELTAQLLKDVRWPGASLGSSAEFQAARSLQQVIEECGSLGFDGRLVGWRDFLAALDRALQETLFSPESQDAPILIAGASESAGLTADAVWFLGASEDQWPGRGNLNPFLPPGLQREARMPHASPQLDWDLAHVITARLLVSASEICFSHPLQIAGVEVGPSRIAAQFAGSPVALPMQLAPAPARAPLTIRFEDEVAIPLPPLEPVAEASGSDGARLNHGIRGGSHILTMQSQCPFKAFATARLGAQDWEPAEAGLSASARGKLLHAVMHVIWGGPPRGIRTLDELRDIADRHAFVSSRVDEVMRNELPSAAREQMPPRYIELEARRLTRLVTEWLEYEAARLPFTVAGTELKTVAEVGDLRFELRLDRIDRLNDGSLLVVDYKTGAVSLNSWNVPRPDDVQLPLYGGFALEPGSELGGLVFAKIRAGDVCFAGRVGDVGSTLGFGLKNSLSLRRNQFKAEQLMEWRDEILRLARDYFDGRADVDPRDLKATCDRCGLQALCRIREMQIIAEEEEAEDGDE